MANDKIARAMAIKALSKIDNQGSNSSNESIENGYFIIETPNDLDPSAESGSIAVAISDGTGSTPITLPEQVSDEEIEIDISNKNISIGNLTYNQTALQAAIAASDLGAYIKLSGESDIEGALYPVINDEYNNIYIDAGFDTEDFIYIPNATKNYFIALDISGGSIVPLEKIVQLDNRYISKPISAYYTFENFEVIVDEDILSFTEGWNIICAIIDTTNNDKDYEFDRMSVINNVDINEYINFVTDGNSHIRFSGTSASQFFNGIAQIETEVPKGLYVKLNDWVHYDIFENKSILNRFTETNNEIKYNDKIIPTIESDDVQLLGFETYNNLVIRDEVLGDGIGIQNVPAYNGNNQIICKLETENGDFICLKEDYTLSGNGTPIREICISIDENIYRYFGKSFEYDGAIIPIGWYNNNEPTIVDFTPIKLIYDTKDGQVEMFNLTELKEDSMSALKTLSQCINISAEAMGKIIIPDNAIIRFAGKIEPNRIYKYKTSLDYLYLDLPSFQDLRRTIYDTQFVLYLDCPANADIVFSSDVLMVNSLLDGNATTNKIIGVWLPEEGKWGLGGINYKAVTE